LPAAAASAKSPDFGSISKTAAVSESCDQLVAVNPAQTTIATLARATPPSLDVIVIFQRLTI
jgi:hypothetical protein